MGQRGRCRTAPYLNNIAEQDHRAIKRRINAKQSFRSFEGPRRTIPGYEAMHMIRMATENRDWGYRRIQGALANLDHEVSRGTIARILKEHRFEPAPERERRTTWREFLSQHRDAILEADFFTIEAWTRKGLTRFLVACRRDSVITAQTHRHSERAGRSVGHANVFIATGHGPRRRWFEFLDATGSRRLLPDVGGKAGITGQLISE
jgi:hypothetical protein